MNLNVGDQFIINNILAHTLYNDYPYLMSAHNKFLEITSISSNTVNYKYLTIHELDVNDYRNNRYHKYMDTFLQHINARVLIKQSISFNRFSILED